MAAFAQFGSDLDASTQQLLNRGSKLTELLKQKQYSPMTVEEQVISIFCGVKGFLDDVELKDIAEFENKILDKCKTENSEILETIRSTGKLDEENDENWIMLVYLKDNDPNSNIVVEDKTDPVKNQSNEYKPNEIFKFSDALVDSLTSMIDREYKKKLN